MAAINISKADSSSSLPWVHAAVCAPVLTYVQHLGVPLTRHLEKHLLPLHGWSDPDTLIARHAFGRFMAGISRSQGIENIGWESMMHGQTSRASFEYWAPHKPTLYSELKASIERTRKHATIEFSLIENRDSVLVHRMPPDNARNYDVELGWGGLAIFIGLVRAFAGKEWRPTRIAMPSLAFAGDSVLAEFSDTKFVPTDRDWWFEIPRRYVSLAPSQFSESGGRNARNTPSGDSSVASQGCGATLGKVIVPYLPSGAPTLERAAEIFGTSPRTLKRRLARANCTYSGVLEETRFAVAKDLLQGTDLKIMDIAREAGYSGASNFTRAFRRTAGMTPHQFRRLRSRLGRK